MCSFFFCFSAKENHAYFLDQNDPAIGVRIEAGVTKCFGVLFFAESLSFFEDLLQKLNSVLLKISRFQSSRE